ncbi:hypothetical protein [Sphingobacterium hungaricum]|uniref:Uncharacterized protein n=1 Tax=Sphingobacterium hungaricum TaxID=2082723 RepID=A0A928V237_9SPHI|nr:hypothetical protein [Sphingobacterium hungaricum]MBE8715551.1 hypothetical protein [Sphingobacterium hungaricum]
MESITIYPENENQKALIKSMLEEMNVPYEISKADEGVLLSEKEFYAKLDHSILQAEQGEVISLSEDKQKEFLGL